MTLRTHRITSLPVAILMPHSACNCRCIMCDIWKGNNRVTELTEEDIKSVLDTLTGLGTRQVVMTGGEALLNPSFFSMCRLIRKRRMHITLLSAGLALERKAEGILENVDDLIVSLDGTAELHDRIRNIPGAYQKLAAGIKELKRRRPGFRVTARCVIHRLNFREWPGIVEAAHGAGVDQISFLAADTTSSAFNRDTPWSPERQSDILPGIEEIPLLRMALQDLIRKNGHDFDSGFIAESPEKLGKLVSHYGAMHGLNPFPDKKCNAPWVSVVIESDGSIKPCFFHEKMGNIRKDGLLPVLNSEENIAFRRKLANGTNDICTRCVCYLNLPPSVNPLRN